jgi:hypothetical protein
MGNSQMTKNLAVCATWILLTFAAVTQVEASIFTFDEPEGFGPGFDGQFNPFKISADGQYRAEAFWLNAGGGHFHTSTFDSIDYFEANHNNSGGQADSLQGVRFSRVDNAPFNLVSMQLYGGAAVGFINNFTTGAGTWTLYSSAVESTVLFGSAFNNVTAVYLADPGAAGMQSFDNRWDDVVLVQTQGVPEASSLIVWTIISLIGGYAGIRRTAQKP